MKNVHPLRAQRRRARREVLLGIENPCCIICGETAIECLQIHEIAGFRRDRDMSVIICVGCHCKQTARLMDAGIEMVREEDPRKRTVRWLEANAVFLRSLADGWERQANLLRRMEDQSD